METRSAPRQDQSSRSGPGHGRHGPARAWRLLAVAGVLSVLAAGCTSPLGKPAPGDRGREMVTALADDPQVQQELARGRGEVIDRDAGARRAILGETIREQRRMLHDPALRGDYLELNARITRAVSADPRTRPSALENTVDLLEGIPDDPELRRRLVNVMRELLQDPALRADLMAMIQSARPAVPPARPGPTPPAPERPAPPAPKHPTPPAPEGDDEGGR